MRREVLRAPSSRPWVSVIFAERAERVFSKEAGEESSPWIRSQSVSVAKALGRDARQCMVRERRERTLQGQKDTMVKKKRCDHVPMSKRHFPSCQASNNQKLKRKETNKKEGNVKEIDAMQCAGVEIRRAEPWEKARGSSSDVVKGAGG